MKPGQCPACGEDLERWLSDRVEDALAVGEVLAPCPYCGQMLQAFASIDWDIYEIEEK